MENQTKTVSKTTQHEQLLEKREFTSNGRNSRSRETLMCHEINRNQNLQKITLLDFFLQKFTTHIHQKAVFHNKVLKVFKIETQILSPAY